MHIATIYTCITLFWLSCFFPTSVFSQVAEKKQDIDGKVSKFLESRRNQWKDLNIPESDGKVLYDLIVKHNYTKALDIGTSTGHSGIWIAWALSKTGGKLITIEINEERYKKALENFAEAGLEDYIDARLADAHKLVPELEGPFDFVFSDADKDWYTNYLKFLLPKLEVGGCFTAHDVSPPIQFRRPSGYLLNRYRGIEEFLDYLYSLPNMETTIVYSSGYGISVSYKKADE